MTAVSGAGLMPVREASISQGWRAVALAAAASRQFARITGSQGSKNHSRSFMGVDKVDSVKHYTSFTMQCAM